jgi:hypothetical protein
MISIRSGFAVMPDGPFNYKPLAFIDDAIRSIFDGTDGNDTTRDPDKGFYEIGRGEGGAWCRMKYPAGCYGMGQQYYQLKLGSLEGQYPLCLQWEWMFEEGFDLSPEKAGKCAPAIQIGAIASGEPTSGTRLMIWYSAQGSRAERPTFSFVSQDQRSGSQWVQPPAYSPEPIACERWYKFRCETWPGAEGYTKYYMDDAPVASIGPTPNNAEDSYVLIDFAYFAGGGAAQAPAYDCYARLRNVHIWTGSEDEPPPAGFVPPAGGSTVFNVTLTGQMVAKPAG